MKSSIVFLVLCCLCLIGNGHLNAADWYIAFHKDGNVLLSDSPLDPNLIYLPISSENNRLFFSLRSGPRCLSQGLESGLCDHEKTAFEGSRKDIASGRKDMVSGKYKEALPKFWSAFNNCKALSDKNCIDDARNNLGKAFKALGYNQLQCLENIPKH